MTASFLIAAPKSNSGKTMLTLGLMKALCNRGLSVQAFKCGPDYIDPMHHTHISGRASYNLDTWMSSEEHVKELFQKHSAPVDVSLVEGVMGLFDGAKKDNGSSAALAKHLGIPVILVVDASSMAYSAAPLLYGFKNFDKEVNLAGVIFNKVASDSHYKFLEDAAIDAGVKPLGYLKRNNDLKIESRHLGLHLPGEKPGEKIVELAAQLIEENVEIDQLLDLCKKSSFEAEIPQATSKPTLKIAIARDEAFNFSYKANEDALRQLGEVRFFSPLNDKELPLADLVWLPGGYPELFLEQLQENESMKKSIKAFAEEGGAIVSECGGMMYLGESITDKEGKSANMCALLPLSTSFENMKLHLGYRTLQAEEMELKGHEFHYSNLTYKEEAKAPFKAINARDMEVEMPVFRYKNLWASYMHLYLGQEIKMKKFLSLLGLNIEDC